MNKRVVPAEIILLTTEAVHEQRQLYTTVNNVAFFRKRHSAIFALISTMRLAVWPRILLYKLHGYIFQEKLSSSKSHYLILFWLSCEEFSPKLHSNMFIYLNNSFTLLILYYLFTGTEINCSWFRKIEILYM